jgi:hypothetical protein
MLAPSGAAGMGMDDAVTSGSARACGGDGVSAPEIPFLAGLDAPAIAAVRSRMTPTAPDTSV